MGSRSVYGDVRLDAATFAVGQLDALLSCHPPLPFWMFRSQLDTARCHPGMDGHRADLHWFITFPHHQRLRVGANLPLAEREGDMPPSPMLSSCTPGWSNLIPDR